MILHNYVCFPPPGTGKERLAEISCSSLTERTVFVSSVIDGQALQVRVHAKDQDVSSSCFDSPQEQAAEFIFKFRLQCTVPVEVPPLWLFIESSSCEPGPELSSQWWLQLPWSVSPYPLSSPPVSPSPSSHACTRLLDKPLYSVKKLKAVKDHLIYDMHWFIL